jgi:predicted Zn-dependent protease
MNRSYKARLTTNASAEPITADISIVHEGIMVSHTYQENYISTLWPNGAFKEIEYKRSIITLSYNSSAQHYLLEITDSDFYNAYTSSYKNSKPFFKPKYHIALKLSLLLLGFVSFIYALYAFALPLLGDAMASIIPVKYEIEIGTQLYESTLAAEKQLTNKSKAINQFFTLIEKDDTYPIKIAVVRNDIENAYALPGGGIIVHDKLIKSLTHYNQLVALLSHEYSHIQKRHATRGFMRSAGGYALLYLVVGDMNGLTGVLMRNADQLRSLSYTRELEQEADDHAMKILKENHIEVSGMKSLFEILKKSSGPQPIEILSTHPDLDTRIENVIAFQKANNYVIAKNDSLQYYFEMLKK